MTTKDIPQELIRNARARSASRHLERIKNNIATMLLFLVIVALYFKMLSMLYK